MAAAMATLAHCDPRRRRVDAAADGSLPSRKEARARVSKRRSRRARRSSTGARRRSTRSKRRFACSRKTPASTPAAAACSPPKGCIELDAAIMDGRDRARRRRRRTAHDARADQPRPALLMEQGPHVFLSGKGADGSLATTGSSRSANSWFEIPERRRQLEELLAAGRIRRRGQIWHGRRGRGRRRRPCRGRDLDRRADRQALGPGRRFAADRRRHLCRRPLGRGLRHRLGRIFHPRRRRAPAGRARAARRRAAAAGARRGARRHRSARRQGRADRGRAQRRRRLGLHDARDVSRHGRRRAAARSRSTPTKTSDRASRAAATRPRWRSPRAQPRRTRRPRRGSSGWGMKCAERVITGS